VASYKGNLRDIEFGLFEWLKIDDIYGDPPFEHVTQEDAKLILSEALKFATEVMSSIAEEGDRLGCRFENGKVIAPEPFKKALKQYMDNGWHLISAPQEYGGQDLPRTMYIALQDFFTGSNTALALYGGSSMMGNTIHEYGTDAQAKRYCPGIFSGRWGGTMVLTEPDVGSDVGGIRTKAKQIEGNVYSIEGTKRFSTGGEIDLFENVIHLLLARIEGAVPGTKGLSLFVVPKIWVHEDGTLGEPNDINCISIEHKLGLNASATCLLNFGENGNCRGVLLGDVEHRGMKIMFELMNEARMWTGLQAFAIASAAYQAALQYAKERLQGADLKTKSPDAPRVPIIKHPGIRRSLMDQKSKIEGMRGLILKTAAYGGRDKAPYEFGMIELFTPLIKGYFADEGFLCINQALQVFGGSGYCKDYPIERYLRDCRVTSIYEGTTHIQAMDLVGRKLTQGGGTLLKNLLAEVKGFVEKNQESNLIREELQLLSSALKSISNQSQRLMELALENIYLIGLQANNFLFSLSELVFSYILLEQALVAQERLEGLPETHPDTQFYAGKIAAARFFVKNNLPNIFNRERIMEIKDTSALEIPEEAF
jgi:alkylation response protein AidB-like acyl-CoA dehydrogenase